MKKMLEKELESESKRKDALSSQDALQYATLCTELGIEPEDIALYNKGRCEIVCNTSTKR